MFIFFHTYIPQPIFFSIGPLHVYWYGFLLALAVILGYWLVGKLARQREFSVEALQSLAVNLIVWSFIGARVYHVLGEWRFYLSNPENIIAFWKGGLAIHGALAAGIIVLWRFSKKHQIGFYKLADIFSLPLILGQAIVRWGNYFNQELMGRPTNLPWSIPIDVARRPAGYEAFSYFHPTFLYESLWDFAVFIILLLMYKRGRKRPSEALAKDGLVFGAYIGLYSLGRLGMELLRIDSAPLLFGMRLPLLVSAALVILGAVISWRALKKA